MGNIDATSTKQKLEALLNGNVEVSADYVENNRISNENVVSHEVYITVEQQAILKAVRAVMCIEALQNLGDIQKQFQVLKKSRRMLSDLSSQYL